VSTNSNIHCILLFRIDSDKFSFFTSFHRWFKKKEQKLFYIYILSILLRYDMELVVMLFPSSTIFGWIISLYLRKTSRFKGSLIVIVLNLKCDSIPFIRFLESIYFIAFFCFLICQSNCTGIHQGRGYSDYPSTFRSSWKHTS